MAEQMAQGKTPPVKSVLKSLSLLGAGNTPQATALQALSTAWNFSDDVRRNSGSMRTARWPIASQ